jgi:hypothetical protein
MAQQMHLRDSLPYTAGSQEHELERLVMSGEGVTALHRPVAAQNVYGYNMNNGAHGMTPE